MGLLKIDTDKLSIETKINGQTGKLYFDSPLDLLGFLIVDFKIPEEDSEKIKTSAVKIRLQLDKGIKLMGIDEYCKDRKITRATLYNWINKGEVQTIKEGKFTFIKI